MVAAHTDSVSGMGSVQTVLRETHRPDSGDGVNHRQLRTVVAKAQGSHGQCELDIARTVVVRLIIGDYRQ